MNRQEGISQNETRSDQSLQSEGSFIVLGRSTSPNDMSLSQVLNGPTSVNNSSTSQASLAANSFHSSIILNDLSPDEIQNKIQAIVQENIELKEALRQNNLAMKQQFDTLVMWQEEVFKVHQNHKQKFEETKELILKLRTENAELRKTLTEFESTQTSTPNEVDSVAKLQSENKILRKKVSEAEARDKVVRLLEFQLKTENADLRGQLHEVQKKLEARSQGLGSSSHKHALAAVAAEREELGGGGNLSELELALPPGKKPASPPPCSFEMVEGVSRRSPCEGGSSCVHGSEESARQLEETRKVLEVERQALEEDRKALEKGRRAMHARVMEADEQRKHADAEREMLEGRVAELTKQLEEERKAGRELVRTLEQSKRENRLESYGKWEVVGVPTDREGTSPIKACESRLGLLRNYFSSQEHKYIKTDVWLQKVNQVIVSLMALDPSKGKEMKEEVASLRKQLLVDSDEVEQQRICLLEAENLLSELKLGFDTLQAQAESVTTVVKENAQANYHEAQARGYRQKLDEVSARLAQAEDDLGKAQAEAVVLSEKLRRAEVEMEAIPVLKTQVEVYQADFNTERDERARMASEKQRLSEEVHRLRGRNQQLLDDLENLGRRVEREENRSPPDGVATTSVSGSGASSRTAVFNTLATPGRGPLAGTAPNQQGLEVSRDRTTRGSSEPRYYTCPKCYRVFMELAPLEVHVNECLDNP